MAKRENVWDILEKFAFHEEETLKNEKLEEIPEEIPEEDCLFFEGLGRMKMAFNVYKKVLFRAKELGHGSVSAALRHYVRNRGKSLMETADILNSSSSTILRYRKQLDKKDGYIPPPPIRRSLRFGCGRLLPPKPPITKGGN